MDSKQKYTIPGISKELQTEIQFKLDNKAKPLGPLGQFETIAMEIGVIQNPLLPVLKKPAL